MTRERRKRWALQVKSLEPEHGFIWWEDWTTIRRYATQDAAEQGIAHIDTCPSNEYRLLGPLGMVYAYNIGVTTHNGEETP